MIGNYKNLFWKVRIPSNALLAWRTVYAAFANSNCKSTYLLLDLRVPLGNHLEPHMSTLGEVMREEFLRPIPSSHIVQLKPPE